MRLTGFIIAIICILPMLLILGAWVFPLQGDAIASWAHIKSTVLIDYSLGTLILVLGTAFWTALIGVGSAWIVTAYDFPLRRLLSWALIMPFAMPAYILAMSYGTLLDFAGPVQTGLRALFDWGRDDYVFPQIRSVWGAVFVLTLASYPYVYMLVRGAFAAQPEEWFHVAQSLGKPRIALFWKIAIPAARPFIIIGLALVVMEVSADIGAVQMLGVPSLATGIYRVWFFFDEPQIAARIASILLIVAAAFLTLERLGRRRARFTTSSTSRKLTRLRLTGASAAFATALCALPVLVGFVIPLIWTSRLAFFSTVQIRLNDVWNATWDSLSLSLAGVAVVILAAFILNSSERRAPPWVKRTHLPAILGYAMPGVVIAIALLILQGLVREAFGLRVLMTGTILGLMIAYLIRFLSPAYSAIEGGFARISPEMDMSAETLGKSRWQIIRYVHLPLLRMPVLIAALIVAIDIFKELPATLILRPFDVRTLAVAVYEFAGNDRPAEGAPYAVVLIAISIGAVYLLARLQERANVQAGITRRPL